MSRSERGPGFRPFAVASVLSAIALPSFLAYVVAYFSYDLFRSSKPEWRARALQEVALVALATTPYAAVAVAGTLGLARSRRWGRGVAMARGAVSLVAVVLSVVIVPVGLVLVFMAMTGVMAREGKDMLIPLFMLPALLAEIGYLVAGVLAVRGTRGGA